MPPVDLGLDLIGDTAVSTLLTVVAGVCLAAALRWRAARAATLLLAWAMLQHATNRMAASPAVQAALGGRTPTMIWIATVTGYFIAVPWALLVEQVVGPGWRSSIRRTWQVFLVFAAAATVLDIVTNRPGAGAGVSRVVVAAGAAVGAANLAPGVARMTADLQVVRAGYLAFMVLVVHDTIAGAGFLPWRTGAGPIGVLVFVACLAYAVVAGTLRGQRNLQTIEHELEMARRIQASLLPAAPPQLDGASLVSRFVPAAAVAGDLFEFLEDGPTRIGVLVADVSGHGVPAALIASMVKVAAAAQRPHAYDPARVLAGIHLAIANGLPPGQFVTAVYAYADLRRGVLRYACAGHPPPLVWRAADRQFVADGVTGPLLISFAPAEYPTSETPLAAGDRILLFTDGVIEAMRADGEMFGVDRVAALVAASAGGPGALVSDILSALTCFAGRRNATFDDDCTLVALEVDAPAARQHPPAG